jgi:hypothetical protein
VPALLAVGIDEPTVGEGERTGRQPRAPLGAPGDLRRLVVRRLQRGRVAPAQRGARVAGELLEGLVGIDDAPAGIDEQRRIRRRPEQAQQRAGALGERRDLGNDGRRQSSSRAEVSARSSAALTSARPRNAASAASRMSLRTPCSRARASVR